MPQKPLSLAAQLANLQSLAFGIIDLRGGFGKPLLEPDGKVQFTGADGETIVDTASIGYFREIEKLALAIAKAPIEVKGHISTQDDRLLAADQWIALVRGDARRLFYAVASLPRAGGKSTPKMVTAFKCHSAVFDRWVEAAWLPASQYPRQADAGPAANRVILQGRGLAIVDGVPKRLNPGRYDVIEALLKAKPLGLTKDGLERVRGDARGMLTRLRQDKDWANVILMTGAPYGRYRIE